MSPMLGLLSLGLLAGETNPRSRWSQCGPLSPPPSSTTPSISWSETAPRQVAGIRDGGSPSFRPGRAGGYVLRRRVVVYGRSSSWRSSSGSGKVRHRPLKNMTPKGVPALSKNLRKHTSSSLLTNLRQNSLAAWRGLWPIHIQFASSCLTATPKGCVSSIG
jgi:hypothetical protein